MFGGGSQCQSRVAVPAGCGRVLLRIDLIVFIFLPQLQSELIISPSTLLKGHTSARKKARHKENKQPCTTCALPFNKAITY